MGTRHAEKPPRRHATICEPLENRLMLAVIQWRQDVSGDFHDPTKWSTGTVPGANDDAVIGDVGSQRITLTKPATIRSLSFDNRTGVATFEASAPLTVSAQSSVGSGGTAVGSVFRTSSTVVGKLDQQGYAAQLSIGKFGQLELIDATVDARLASGGVVHVFGDTSINKQLYFTGDFHVSGSHAHGDARLTVPDGFTNYGRIWLDGPRDTASILKVVNAPLINSNFIASVGSSASGAPGERSIEGALVNRRTIQVDTPLRLQGGNHVNEQSGSFTLRADLAIGQTPSSTFTTSGTFKFEPSDGGGDSDGPTLHVQGGTFNNESYGFSGSGGSIRFDGVTVNSKVEFLTPVPLTANDSQVLAALGRAGQLPVPIDLNHSYVRFLKDGHKATVRGETTIDGLGRGEIILRDDPRFGPARLTTGAGQFHFHYTGTIELDTRSTIIVDTNLQFTWRTIVNIGNDSDPTVPRIMVGGEIGNSVGGSFEIRTAPGFEPPRDYKAVIARGTAVTGSLPYVFGTTSGGSPFKLRHEGNTLAVAVAPEAPSKPDLETGSDSGVSTTDNITNADAPTFVGTAPDDVTVRLIGADARVLSTTVPVNGTYRMSLPALPEGAYEFTAETVDVDGDTNTSGPITVRIDRTAPRLDSMGARLPEHPLYYSNAIALVFDERIVGLDPADVRFSHEGAPFPASVETQVSQMIDRYNFVTGFRETAPQFGSYAATIASATAGITDVAGNAWTGDGAATWFEHTVADTPGDDHIRIVRDPADPQLAHVFLNDQTAPKRSFNVTRIPFLRLVNVQGADSITLDMSNGSPGLPIEVDVINYRLDDRVIISGLGGRQPLRFRAKEFTVGDFRMTHGGVGQVMAAPGETLHASGIHFDENATFDLRTSALVIHADAPTSQAVLSEITASIASARNTAPTPWTGPGLTSSAAAADPLTTLAVGLLGDDIVVKHTYHGDANLDGVITSDDYFRVDSGFLAQPAVPTFSQGDFNYDGQVTSDDYFLIDSAFLGQSAPPAASAVPTSSAAAPTGLPADTEPESTTRKRGRPTRPLADLTAAAVTTRRRKA